MIILRKGESFSGVLNSSGNTQHAIIDFPSKRLVATDGSSIVVRPLQFDPEDFIFEEPKLINKEALGLVTGRSVRIYEDGIQVLDNNLMPCGIWLDWQEPELDMDDNPEPIPNVLNFADVLNNSKPCTRIAISAKKLKRIIGALGSDTVVLNFFEETNPDSDEYSEADGYNLVKRGIVVEPYFPDFHNSKAIIHSVEVLQTSKFEGFLNQIPIQTRLDGEHEKLVPNNSPSFFQDLEAEGAEITFSATDSEGKEKVLYETKKEPMDDNLLNDE